MNITINSNMTHEEIFRLTGSLPESSINELLDAQEQLDAIGNIAGSLIDADQYPDEDFLQDAIDELGLIAKRMRGDNRADLTALSAKLEELQLSISRAAEYGRECLNNATKTIK